jgi:D-serine deaminase-like pyridoxal phosphate-dependent protein
LRQKLRQLRANAKTSLSFGAINGAMKSRRIRKAFSRPVKRVERVKQHELLAAIINIFKDCSDGLSIEQIDNQILFYIPRRTLQRRLKQLEGQVVVSKGGTRSRRYFSLQVNTAARFNQWNDNIFALTKTLDWFKVPETDKVDSPALLILPELVKHNIRTAIEMAGSADRLRPHVKTCKSPDAVRLMQQHGINKFKCATISEAEMLGAENAKDVLLAYQPVGPKLQRFISLIKKYPATRFSCLVDNMQSARQQVDAFSKAGVNVSVYVDVNVGMNRSGITPGPSAVELINYLLDQPCIQHVGLHLYDGHINSTSLLQRVQEVKTYFSKVNDLMLRFQKHDKWVRSIAGGSTTFPVHAKNEEVDCSPGTFIYWDKFYLDKYEEQNFLPAAIVLCRVVSVPDNKLITVDLGHKSIASENDINRRVFFLNEPDLVPDSHSEEHLVLKNNGEKTYSPGDVLYGIPFHVCPTVALYEGSIVVESGMVRGEWLHTARDRKIEI